MATTHLEIVTPEGRIYGEDVESVVVPGVSGELGILPMHAPLMTKILPGELTIHKGSHIIHLAVGEGFLEVTQTRVSVLTDMAIKESDIDESAVEVAIRRAHEAMAKDQISDEDMVAAKAILQKSLAQLRVKRRRG